jgi:hypothetical protein
MISTSVVERMEPMEPEVPIAPGSTGEAGLSSVLIVSATESDPDAGSADHFSEARPRDDSGVAIYESAASTSRITVPSGSRPQHM